MIKSKLLIFITTAFVFLSPIKANAVTNPLEDTLDVITPPKLAQNELQKKVYYYITPYFFYNLNKPYIISYDVKAGDTVETIAKEFNVSLNTVLKSNNIKQDDLLQIGQALIFPSINGILYEIKPGDTLESIAKEYKITVAAILESNDSAYTQNLTAGDKIILKGTEKAKEEETSSTTKNIEKKSSSSNAKSTANTTSSNSQKTSKNTNTNKAKTTTTVKESNSLSFIWPASGSLSSPFGMRHGKMHTGIDIAASYGSEVKASLGGKVVFSGWKGGYGNLVIIDHNNGYQTYYAHNSKLLVQVGQSVTKGATIALVGSTGNSTGPHSHFEIRKNGSPVSPLSFLK